ncbi:MAG: hypothetical protein ACOH1T_01115 [Microbacteriaceae bacterium]
MTYSPPDESTLGVLVGVRDRRQRMADPSSRVRQDDGRHRASLGTAFIGIGAALVVAVRAIYGFSWFISLWGSYPNPVPALLAWLLLVGVLVTAFVTARVIGDHLPDWMFLTFVALLAAVIALDLVAIWELHDIGRNATAALTAAMSLLVVITLRRTRDLAITTAAFGGVIAAAMVINTPLTGQNLPPQITSLAFAVLPAVIGISVVTGFRRMVQIELDRVLVQSTVSAPRFAVGMMASEELARLDLAAEEMLDAVATGRYALPLKPKVASVAASLATELRLHLIEGRRETWLYHAISESEMLGRSVTLVDKGSLAGLLDANQRDGLLAGIWLLLSDNVQTNTNRTVTVQVGPIVPTAEGGIGKKLAIPIVVTTSNVMRNRIDPSTWDAIRRVGRYSDSTQSTSLRVDIECFVDNPADV